MRLIDADALLARMRRDPLFSLVERYGVSGVIEAEPTVDAVEVVRCKDCKWYVPDGDGWGTCVEDCSKWEEDGYCSWGERKGEENA